MRGLASDFYAKIPNLLLEPFSDEKQLDIIHDYV